MEYEGMCQVYKVEELKRYGQYRVTATSLGRKEKYTIQFLTNDKNEFPIGQWVTVKLS